ncbi:uncharacterized protein EV420DRAFT_1641280 [Desarmillaria tabescens]|uniref:Uncharacterized protein n=1 Tax=Armillaria tabescens TaxID=1929756 RepID=A0AA39N825_ARMTA|nr:uncharacterized protein EV420DRAFT_1641280 [Desarmillaria tabescens]KAK0460749.1 hypothetical protein EV420DRAFT_1641280 [Desarmillaria tabescens]
MVSPLERASIEDMLLAAEETLRNLPGYRLIAAEDWIPDMDSHVMLAACRGDEVAKARQVKKEKGMEVWSGVFTNSLLKVLKSGVLEEEATYVDLINALP